MLHRRLGDALAAARAAARCPDRVHDPERPARQDLSADLDFKQFIAERLARLGLRPWLYRWGATSYIARHRWHPVPLVLVVAGEFETDDDEWIADPMPRGIASTLRTSIPDALPGMSVEPKGRLDAFTQAIGIGSAPALGDRAFDRAFGVKGNRQLCAALLEPSVRRSLGALEAHAPRLTTEHGIAELQWRATWRGDPTDILPDAALAVLHGIRAVVDGLA